MSVSETFAYDAYGVATGFDPSTAGTNLLYTGEQFDSSLDQYYLRARYYDPSNGRFNRVDPFAGNNQDPQSLHKYTYVHNNPVNSIDPSGMMSFSLTGLMTVTAIIGGVIGIVAGSMFAPPNSDGEVTIGQRIKWALIGLALGAMAGALIGGATWVAMNGGLSVLTKVVAKGIQHIGAKLAIWHSKSIAAGVAGFIIGLMHGWFEPDYAYELAASGAIALSYGLSVLTSGAARCRELFGSEAVEWIRGVNVTIGGAGAAFIGMYAAGGYMLGYPTGAGARWLYDKVIVD